MQFCILYITSKYLVRKKKNKKVYTIRKKERKKTTIKKTNKYPDNANIDRFGFVLSEYKILNIIITTDISNTIEIKESFQLFG